ncbi:putative reverse transcriptase domain-containing protein [Tanacetum coccineum]
MSSSKNAAIKKPENPKSRSKHLAPTTPRTWSTSTTLLVPTKRPPPVTNYALGLAAVKTWQQILNREFGIKKAKEDVGGSSDVRRKDKLITKKESSSLSPKIVLQTVDQIDHPSKSGVIKSSVSTCAGWPAAASRGGGTGGRVGRGGGRTRGRSGDQGDGRNDGPGGLVGGQGSEVTKVEVKELVGTKTAMPSMTTYRVMLGIPLKAMTIEKMESVHDMSGCRDSQRVKYSAGSFVGKALTWWNSKIRTRGREAVVGMSWEDFKILTREEFYPNNEMQKLETELWNHAMVGAGHATYTDRFHELARLVPHLVIPKSKKVERNGREDNKRTKTVNAFATTTNPVRGCYTSMAPKCTACGYHHSPETPCRSCFNCNRLGHFARDYRVAPRNVNPINARSPIARTCFECVSIDHIKSACPRINQAQRPGGNQKTKLWLLMGIRVMETKGTEIEVGHS